jgi:hypothetical protein
MPSIIARICEGPRTGQILVIRERGFTGNNHSPIDAIDGKIYHDPRTQEQNPQLLKYGTIFPGRTAGIPKGQPFLGEPRIMAAIREFVEETGTLPPENRLFEYAGSNGIRYDPLANTANVQYFLWNVTQAQADQIINTYYQGPRHFERHTFLHEGNRRYIYRTADGPAYRKYESFLLQFVDLNTVTNDTLETGSEPDVPVDFRITPENQEVFTVAGFPAFEGLNAYTNRIRTHPVNAAGFQCNADNITLPTDDNANQFALDASPPGHRAAWNAIHAPVPAPANNANAAPANNANAAPANNANAAPANNANAAPAPAPAPVPARESGKVYTNSSGKQYLYRKNGFTEQELYESDIIKEIKRFNTWGDRARANIHRARYKVLTDKNYNPGAGGGGAGGGSQGGGSRKNRKTRKNNSYRRRKNTRRRKN